MSNNPYRDDKEDLKELLSNYEGLKQGVSHSFIEEDGFEKIIDFYIQKEKYTDALVAANFSIEQFPYSADLLIKKADVLVSMRRFQDALHILEMASILGVREAQFYIIKIDALLALERSEEVEFVFEEVLELFTGEDRINVLFELADVFDDYESFDKVFDCLRLILMQEPSNEEALFKICFWTDFTGRNEEGIKLHQEIIEETPFNELAWFNLGAAYQGIKLYEKAIDAYQYAVAIDEKFDYAYRNMGDAFIKLKKFKDAIDVLERVLVLARPESIIYEAIGHCYDKIDNFSLARNNYRKALHLNTEDSQLHYKVACTYMNEGDWNNAIKYLQIALKIHLLQPEYNLALGRCYLELNNYADAIIYLGNAVRVKPKNITGWIELLNCFYQAALYDDGFEYAALAFEQTAAKPIFLYYKSAFLFASSQSKEGLVYLQHALGANSKLIKQFIDINPSILQNQQVVELLAQYKKTSRKKK